MRVFLSEFSGFTLAVSMDAVASMMFYNQEMEKIIRYDQENRNTYVSLPLLFNQPSDSICYGIVLRNWNTRENKVVLITAEIKRDIEIPDDQFYPIPKSMGALRFSEMFSGIHFAGNPVLLLNIEQLAQSVMRNTQEI
jgi:chemotaxis signal transduction protein